LRCSGGPAQVVNSCDRALAVRATPSNNDPSKAPACPALLNGFDGKKGCPHPASADAGAGAKLPFPTRGGDDEGEGVSVEVIAVEGDD
jgi:hypothetical protein